MAKKQVPHSVEAEEGVLGSILLDSKWALIVWDLLTPSMFYIRENQMVYEAISFLKNEAKPIDLLTVRTYLDDRDLLEQVGGNEKLISLADSIFHAANIEQYAKIVRNKFLRRQAIQAASSIDRMARDDEATNDDVFSWINTVVNSLSMMSVDKGSRTIDEDIFSYQEWLLERQGKSVFGYSWWENLKWLDESTDGIQRKKTYRIGANSNVGKTQLVYNIIVSLLKQGAKVAFFTLENERVTTLNYILANLQGENSRDLVRGDVKADIDMLVPYLNLLTIIDDTNDIWEITKRVEKGNYDVVVLDYIGLIKVKGATTEGKFAEYAERIPSIAKQNNLSWIDLSNLPKNADDDTIRLYGEFFGSSALRNNLDVGIHLTYYKPFYTWKDETKKMRTKEQDNVLHTKQVLNLMITKNRLWPTGIEKPFVVSFNKGGRMTEATEEDIARWSF